MKSPSLPRAFTLVELLVVLAIIALLFAMLMPSMEQAKKKAQSAVCKSRERQIGIALAVYSTDFIGFFPYAAPYWTSSWGIQSTAGEFCWTWRVSPYLGNYRINQVPKQLTCPSNPWTVVLNSTQRVNPPSTYGMGQAFPVTPTATRGTPQTTAQLRDVELKTPSRTLMLGETPMGQNTEYGRNFEEGQSVGSTAFRTDNIQYYGDAPTGYWYSAEIAARPGGTNPIARVNHNFGWNSLMCDGSVRFDEKTYLQQLAGNASWTAGKDAAMFWANK